jgi:CDP-diacylglycerol--glycerol-3-phosphate 3-phosphatidyltransferase
VVAFGPSALATPANAVTVARLVLAPVLLAAILVGERSWAVLVVWILLSSTDGLDGFLARRHGTTRSGAFLDPLADKFLVLGAMAVLVADGRMWWLPVSVIAVREVAMSVYRSVLARAGASLPARPLAKAKTWCQSIAVGCALLPVSGAVVDWLVDVWVWVAVVLTVASGAQYYRDCRRVGTRAL